MFSGACSGLLTLRARLQEVFRFWHVPSKKRTPNTPWLGFKEFKGL